MLQHGHHNQHWQARSQVDGLNDLTCQSQSLFSVSRARYILGSIGCDGLFQKTTKSSNMLVATRVQHGKPDGLTQLGDHFASETL